ncbi:MAG: hypothetical protein ACE5HL_00775 [Terriglobia bacterium]
MGILEALTGRTKVLRYRIVFGADKIVGVHVEPCVPQIPGPEYIRLWASYEAKTIFNLGFPGNLSATMALGSVAKVADKAITADTDCFQRAHLADAIQFAHKVPTSGTTFTGELYAKGSLERTIKTHFPMRITEQQVVYSGLALMQYAISINRTDDETLDVLTKTARNFLALYESGMGGGVESVVQIPTLAYMQAIGVA